MSTDAYRRKRDPARTPEPFGDSPTADAQLFVVQRHSARRLHYDLRLAEGGVLRSWAVPKGIPLDRGARHLAVQVEDHPLDYATFAGVIPAGQYGAGTVELWDRGTYEVVERKPDGGLTFRLQGERLHGVWTLVPAHLEGKAENWLLLRKDAGPERCSWEPMLASVADA
ncbi:MAG: DNA polymerase ligase N-terminal domain-containing protein, partial [Gaiella sp.]